MADNPNKQAGGAQNKPRSGRASQSTRDALPELPPSKALQWFLLVAFVISGAAYVVNEWSELTTSKTQERHNDKLRLLVQSQSEYLSHRQAGDEALAKKRYDQAVSEYRLALQGQNIASAHESLGQALLKRGDPDAAIAQFREALRLDPGSATAVSVWGTALAVQSRLEEAVKVLKDGLNRNPESGLLHYNLATTLIQMQTDSAGRRRMAASAGDTSAAEAAGNEAKTLAAEALRHFIKASRNGIDSPAFWSAYGQLLNQLGQYAEAESCLLRAVAKDVSAPTALSNGSHAMGKEPRAPLKDESMATAHFQLALAEDRLGKYAEAIAHYERALALTPDDPATLNNLALLYATATNAEVRTPKMATLLATRACDATTDQNARYMDTLARCYAAAGDFFQAITWEDKAIHRATQLNDGDLAKELQARYALFMDHKID